MANGRHGESGLHLDLTVPDPARIMDYWLGGSHHFEVDRTMAKAIEKLTPIAPVWGRAQRQFLRRVVTYLYEEIRLSHFLVTGAGLPTCGNVHEVIPQAKVLYTDLNPVTVAYGRHILGNNPSVGYVLQDARRLHEIDPGELTSLFGEARRLAIIYVGVSYFFPEPVLKKAMHDLYEWAAPGSHLAITSLGDDSLRYAAPSVEAYARMGHPLFPRSMEQTREVIEPWTVSAQGVKAATHWGIPDATEPVPPVYFYSCLAYKPG